MALFANAAPTLDDLLGYLRGGDVDFSYADMDISWFTSPKPGFSVFTYADGRNAFHDIAKAFLTEKPRATRLMLEYFGTNFDSSGKPYEALSRIDYLQDQQSGDGQKSTNNNLLKFESKLDGELLVFVNDYCNEKSINRGEKFNFHRRQFMEVFYTMLSELKRGNYISSEGNS